MKFPMLRISLILIVAIFLCVLFLPNDKNTELAYGMSEVDQALVLGVSEELVDGNYDISQVVPKQETALPDNKDIAPIVPRFSGANRLDIDGCKGAVLDEKSETVLYDSNADEVAPIASISKLMTALVFLKNNPGWETDYIVKATDQVGGGKTWLITGETVKVKDIFYACLVGSDNTAAMALARSTGLSDKEFIDKMNETAKDNALLKTEFADPVGLSHKNVSTAREVAKLAKIALASEDISKALAIKVYEYRNSQGVKKNIKSTNSLLFSRTEKEADNLGGKTGYTKAAGYCFVGRFVDKNGTELISAILGSTSINSRFALAHELSEWTFENYEWQ